MNNFNNNNKNNNNIYSPYSPNDIKKRIKRINYNIKELQESLIGFISHIHTEFEFQRIKLQEIKNDLNDDNLLEIEYLDQDFQEKLEIFKSLYDFIKDQTNEITIDFNNFNTQYPSKSSSHSLVYNISFLLYNKIKDSYNYINNKIYSILINIPNTTKYIIPTINILWCNNNTKSI